MKKSFLRFAVVFALLALIICAFAVTAHAEENEIPPCTAPGSNGVHMAGRNATCETDAVCDLCGEILVPRLGHNPGPVATCAAPQTCTTCQKVLVPQLEQNEENCLPNIDAATCTESRVCKICSRVMNKALGHTEEGTADCGHAVRCSTCKAITQNATGKHTLDWENATTVREAGEGVPELIEVTCTTCNRKYERARLTSNTTTNGSIAATGDTAEAVFEVEILKVADYADTKLGKKYDMLQTFTAALRTNDGNVQPSDKVEVTIALNKTLSEMGKDDVKLFVIKEDGSYEELEIISMENGSVKFETEYLAQFAIVEKGGLPLGALIGIIAGAVVLVGGGVAAIVIVACKKKKNKAADAE